MKEENIIDVLQNQHHQIRTYLLDVRKEKKTEKIQACFKQLEEVVQLHFDTEESVLYDELTENGTLELERYAQTGKPEHSKIKQLLLSLNSKGVQSDSWSSTFNELAKKIEGHLNREEKEMFPEIKRVYADVELKRMAKDFVSKKDTRVQQVA